MEQLEVAYMIDNFVEYVQAVQSRIEGVGSGAAPLHAHSLSSSSLLLCFEYHYKALAPDFSGVFSLPYLSVLSFYRTGRNLPLLLIGA